LKRRRDSRRTQRRQRQRRKRHKVLSKIKDIEEEISFYDQQIKLNEEALKDEAVYLYEDLDLVARIIENDRLLEVNNQLILLLLMTNGQGIFEIPTMLIP